METCLLIISVLSYILPKRNDLVDILERTLKENAQYFYANNNLPFILKSRFCLFLGYFSDTIFLHKDNKDLYNKGIEILIQSAIL